VKLLLTDRFCDRAKPQNDLAQTDYFDETVSGLALRVAASGRKTWTLHFTSPGDGKRARLTLDTYPATSLGAARAQALQARGGTPLRRFARSIFGVRPFAAKLLVLGHLSASFIRSSVADR
jgi:hypothetical protein